MGHQESYKLRWGEFEENLSTSLQELRESGEFLDVTLALDESHQFKCHRVVLSASSPYFRSLLKRNPGPNPLLVMPPICKFTDMMALLEFMYNGEVSVNNDELESFMALAEMLKVKGLTSQDKPPPKPKMPIKMPKFPSGIQINRQRPNLSSPSSKKPRLSCGTGSSSSSIGGSVGQGPSTGGSLMVQDYPDEDDEDEDDEDIHEMTQQDNDFFDEYENEENPSSDHGNHGGPGGEYYESGNGGHPSTHPPPPPIAVSSGGSGGPSGTQLMGLICPDCRIMCQGVQALKDHMAHHCRARNRGGSGGNNSEGGANFGMGSGLSGPPSVGGRGRGGSGGPPNGEPVNCNICDKQFKNQKSMVAHQKRVHKVGGTGNQSSFPGGPEDSTKKRGRPCKKSQTQQQPASNVVVAPSAMNPAEDNLDEEQEYYQESSNAASSSSSSSALISKETTNRPIGQVPPAPRPSGSNTPQPPQQQQQQQQQPSQQQQQQQQQQQMGLPSIVTDKDQDDPMPSSHRGGPSQRGPSSQRGGPSSQSGGPGRKFHPQQQQKQQLQQQQQKQQRIRPGPHQGKNMDLQKLGMKFGGQISITSSDNSPGGGGGGGIAMASTSVSHFPRRISSGGGVHGGSEGVSISKLKSDMTVGSPINIKDVGGRRVAQQLQQQQQQQQHESPQHPPPPPIEVKQEPTYDVEDEDGSYDERAGVYHHHHQEGDEGEYTGDISGSAVVGMYAGYGNNMEEDDLEDEESFNQEEYGEYGEEDDEPHEVSDSKMQ